jgi:drug/metabolite transporter (DMT)-like permease
MSGVWWMLLAQALFALMNIGTRLGARHLPWSEVAFGRFAVGVAIAGAVAASRPGGFRIVNWKASWLRSVFGTLAALGTFYALSSPRLPIGDAATLGATTPIFVALLAGPLLGERVGRGLGIAVVLAFLGVALIVRPSFGAALDVALLATAAAFCFALALLSLRRMGPHESPEAIVVHFSAVAAVTMLAVSIPSLQWPTATEAMIVLATGLAGGFAQLAMTRAYAHLEATRATALSYAQVLFTYVLAAVLFAEAITPVRLAGAALVGVGGWMATRRNGQAPKDPPVATEQ